jgi:hypothetical protein
MSRAYELHRNGDCGDGCGVCEWEDVWALAETRFCEECDGARTVMDEFDDQIGYEEQARPVRVTALDCGHDIVKELRR